jgi:hypothetical protein
MLIIKLLVLILILFVVYNYGFATEPFTHMLGSPVHQIIDIDGNVLATSYNTPRGDGYAGCTVVPCVKQDQNTTCWFCCNYS